MMNFALQMMDFVRQMMNFVLLEDLGDDDSKFIVFNAKSIIFTAKSIIFTAKCSQTWLKISTDADPTMIYGAGVTPIPSEIISCLLE